MITTTPGLCVLHDRGLCWIQYVDTCHQNETAVPYQGPRQRQWLSSAQPATGNGSATMSFPPHGPSQPHRSNYPYLWGITYLIHRGGMLMLRLSPLFLPFITLLSVCLVQQIRKQCLVSSVFLARIISIISQRNTVASSIEAIIATYPISTLFGPSARARG